MTGIPVKAWEQKRHLRRKQQRSRSFHDYAGTSDEDAWFCDPWNDGRNAVRLMEQLAIRFGGEPLPDGLQAILRDTSPSGPGQYTELTRISAESGFLPGVSGVVIPAAAQCLANWIAQSHGGGVVPNVYLRGVVSWMLWRGADTDAIRWEIARARARDANLPIALTAEFTRLWFSRRYALAKNIAASVR